MEDEIFWTNASEGDQNTLEMIKKICSQCPKLVNYMFKPDKPEMLGNYENMMKRSLGMSSGEFILYKICCHLWFQEGSVSLNDIIHRLDNENFKNVMEVIHQLREQWT